MHLNFFSAENDYQYQYVNCDEYMVTSTELITRWNGPYGAYPGRFPEIKHWPLTNIRWFEVNNDEKQVTTWTEPLQSEMAGSTA